MMIYIHFPLMGSREQETYMNWTPNNQHMFNKDFVSRGSICLKNEYRKKGTRL